MNQVFNIRIQELQETLNLVTQSCVDEFKTFSELVIKTFENNRKLLICGNGGSAADSQHLAAEFISSFGSGLARRSLPAIALTVDSSIMTAISNDFDFSLVFSRQIEGIGMEGDALLTISTSGESRNCLSAITMAKEKKMKTLALTRSDSTLYKNVDAAIGIPSKNTQHIQECHIVLYHCLAEIVERHFLGK